MKILFRLFNFSALLLTSLALLCGCAATVSESGLRAAATTTQSDTLGRVVYLGRNGDYDYFEMDWNFNTKTFRIKQPNDVVKTPMAYGSTPVPVGPFGNDRWLP